MTTPAAPTRRTVAARARAGQAATELAVVMALVAALCLPAISFTTSAVRATFSAQQAALTTPASAISTPVPIVTK